MTKENRKLIGQVIRNKRVQVNITQLELSERTGISRNYISNVENGRYVPSVETLIKLAKILNLNLNFLLKMTEIQVNKRIS